MERPLTTIVEPQEKYVILKFNGDIDNEQIAAFKEDLAAAAEVISKQFKKMGKKICILLDVSGFSGNYSLEALTDLVSFAKNNRLFVERTASFGGSEKVKMAGEVAVSLSGRENIKIFEKEEEAVAWLLSA